MDERLDMSLAYTGKAKMVAVPSTYVHAVRLVNVRPVSQEEIVHILENHNYYKISPLLTVDRDGYDSQVMFIHDAAMCNDQIKKPGVPGYSVDPDQTGWVMGGAWAEAMLPPENLQGRAIFNWAMNTGYSETYLRSVFRQEVNLSQGDWWTRRSVGHLSIAPLLIPVSLRF